ncbi:hypothetical protein [Amycolatopsis anabasis]|uniref:hypothetical protein n=1 Tax=Amycolatopsis anabasis TaxID=1840409 RepID=UPI00131B9F8E|nr:hypothetical protein [Amycolatopsis anabasis]
MKLRDGPGEAISDNSVFLQVTTRLSVLVSCGPHEDQHTTDSAGSVPGHSGTREPALQAGGHRGVGFAGSPRPEDPAPGSSPAGGDPRHLADGDRRWAIADPQARALYLGTGLRCAGPHPEVHGTTIARLVAGTALFLTIGAGGQPLVAQASKPYRLSEDTRPADGIDALADPRCLRSRIRGILVLNSP